jgi:hypothetical protein
VSNRFWSKVKFDNVHLCWEWQANKNWKGYGTFRLCGKILKAHRVAYKLYYKVFLGEKHVLHSCDNPGCVNPFHLFLGTNADNMKDRGQKGRCRAGIRNLEKTHCPQGHLYSGGNLRIGPKGDRFCRRCVVIRRMKNVE